MHDQGHCGAQLWVLTLVLEAVTLISWFSLTSYQVHVVDYNHV